MVAGRLRKEKVPKDASQEHMTGKKLFEELLEAIGPAIDNLRRMLGAARHGFNRDSLDDLQEVNRLQGVAAEEIKAIVKRVGSATVAKSDAERAPLLRVHEILSRLGLARENISALGDAIRKKIEDKLLFTDKAFFDINYIFTHQTGLMRSLLDVVRTDNQLLRRYLEEEGQNLIQVCLNAATEHETRLIEGLCLPQSSPVFLSILDHMRTICSHVLGIVRLRGKE